MQYFLIYLIIILNSGIISYNFFTFGILDFSYSVHCLLNIFILYQIYKKYKRVYNFNQSINRNFVLIVVYLSIIFCWDLITVGKSYQDFAMPDFLSKILIYYFILLLLNTEIENVIIFLKNMQFIFFGIGVLTILLYFTLDPIKSKDMNLWLEEYGFLRFRHSFYHFSMFSIYLSSIQFFVLKKEFQSEKYFISCNLIVQYMAIVLTNYRTSLASAFLLLYFSFLIYLFRQKEKAVAYLIIIISFLIFLILISINPSNTGIFARFYATESISDDPNMVWRYVELVIALSQMTSVQDFIFGVGYLKPFMVDDLKVFYLHNGYISILYNFGLIAVFLFASLIYKIIKLILRHFKSNFMFGLSSLIFLIGLLFQNYSSGIFNRDGSATLSFGFFIFFLDRLKNKNYVKTLNQTSLSGKSEK